MTTSAAASDLCRVGFDPTLRLRHVLTLPDKTQTDEAPSIPP